VLIENRGYPPQDILDISPLDLADPLQLGITVASRKLPPGAELVRADGVDLRVQLPNSHKT